MKFIIGIRLLSCETPDEYGAIVFQDNIVHGAVIGINFFIRDLYARGFQKKYSLAVIIDDDQDSVLESANCSAGDELVANTENVISLLDSIVRVIKYDCEKGEESDTVNSCISKDVNGESNDVDRVEYVGPQIDFSKLHQQLSKFLITFSNVEVSSESLCRPRKLRLKRANYRPLHNFNFLAGC